MTRPQERYQPRTQSSRQYVPECGELHLQGIEDVKLHWDLPGWRENQPVFLEQDALTRRLCGTHDAIVEQKTTADQRAICDDLVYIPMAQGVDSLNLSVAGGLLMYEALRATDQSGPGGQLRECAVRRELWPESRSLPYSSAKIASIRLPRKTPTPLQS